MPNARIIDISYAQSQGIDWLKIKAQNIGAMIRAGQNTWEDNLFRQHLAGAQAAGVSAGMYWFFQPDARPEYQAQACIEIWNSLVIKPEVIALDVENIAYTAPDGTRVNIMPPSIAAHDAYLRAWLKAVEAATGIIPMIYTRQDYWNAWTIASPDWAHYPLWVASWTNYSANIAMPRDWKAWKIWQFEGGTGRTDGVVGPVDQNYFNGDSAAMVTYFGGKVEPMATGIHDVKVPMEQRAWVMEYKADQKLAQGVSLASLGLDAVILPMVNTPWNGNHSVVLPEPTFSGRFTEAGAAPVFGLVEIDAGIATTEQHTQPEFDGHSIRQNIYVREILTAWHVGPWTQGNLKPADFRPIKGLIFEQTTTQDHQTPRRDILDFWQAYMFKYVVDKLRALMAGGAIPSVPCILKTTGEWLQKYPVDFSTMLDNPERKKWLNFALSDPHLESTSIMPDLYSIFKYAPGDDYKYPYVPDGYADRVVLFEFTAGKQRMSFASGTAYLSKAFTDAARFNAWMGAVVIVPPPVEPPVPGEIITLSDAITHIKALELRIETLQGLPQKIVQQVGDLEAWRGEMGKVALPK